MFSNAKRMLVCLLIAGVSVFAIACGDDGGSSNNGGGNNGGSSVDGDKKISELDADEQQSICDSMADAMPDITQDEVCLGVGNATAAAMYAQDDTTDLEAACNDGYSDGDCGVDMDQDGECELPENCEATVDEFTACNQAMATALEDHYGSVVACADFDEEAAQSYENFEVPTECSDLGEDCGF